MKSLFFRTINGFSVFLLIFSLNSYESIAGLVGESYPKIKIGPRIGINFCQLTDNDTYYTKGFNDFYNPDYYFTFNSQNLSGISLGFQTEIMIDKYFSTIFELNYNQVGSLLSGTISDSTGSAPTQLQRRISYLQIPVLAKFSIGNGNYRFNFFGGPALNLALAGKEKFVIGRTTQYDEEVTIGELGGINQIDVSLILGIGFTMKFDNLEWSYDLRYNRGFIDTNYTPINGYSSVYNSVISLSTSIAFEL